jgi:VanZ family protein
VNGQLRYRKIWLSLWFFGMLLGLYLSLKPGVIKEQIIPHLDKIIHGFSYALLAVFAACIFEQKKSTKLAALLWLVMLSGLIELAQGYLTSTRTMEFADFLANCAGISLGAYVAKRCNILRVIERVLS